MANPTTTAPIKKLTVEDTAAGVFMIGKPKNHSLTETLKTITAHVEAMGKSQNFVKELKGTYYQDALLACHGVVMEVFPMAVPDPESWRKATKLTISRPDGSSVEIPVGAFLLAKLDDPDTREVFQVKIAYTVKGGDACNLPPYAALVVEASGFAEVAVQEMFKKVDIAIKENTFSKIKGQIIEMSMSNIWNGDDYAEDVHDPKPVTGGGADIDDLVYDGDTSNTIRYQILNRIEKKDELAKRGVQFRSNFMLAGGYGTGKSVLISAILQRAKQNGITCVMVKDVRDLQAASDWVKPYEPALLVSEDVDRIMQGEERTINQDNLTNAMDGIGSKDRQLMMIMTANEVDKIHPVFLRPGRTTAVVNMKSLGVNEVLRLIAKVAKVDVTVNADEWRELAEHMSGTTPSTVTDVVKAARAVQLGDTNIGVDDPLTPANILMAYRQAMLQIGLAERKVTPPVSDRVSAAREVANGLGQVASALREVGLLEESQPQPTKAPPARATGGKATSSR